MYIDVIWVGFISTLIVFSHIWLYKFGKVRGYKVGANHILNEWKKWIKEVEDGENE